ncbi:MAG: LytR/AlgR family response regulator transcription factor [Ginsengibacter sp.]
MNNLPILKCLIIDDEPPAREIIHSYINEVPVLEFAGECGNALQSISFLQQNDIDLIFLDIKMPQMNGNEFLKTIKRPPPVIFTTAHIDYAMEGYELDVIDYLLKPIKFERFLKAVNKAFILKGSNVVDMKAVTDTPATENFVYFRCERKMVKVMLHDVLYIESMKDYVKIFTKEGTVVTKLSLNAVQSMLPEKEFLRTHRSYIVSAAKIKSYTHELVEINKTEIPIGKLYRKEVLEVLSFN